MAIEDNKGHSGQGAEGTAPAHQHPAESDAKDVGQRKDTSDNTSDENTDGRPGNVTGQEPSKQGPRSDGVGNTDKK